MLLARENIRPQALPSEEHSVPELGGSVLVQGMSMPQLLAFTSARRRLTEPRDGETPAQAAERASGELLALLLHTCVLAADMQPVYSVAEWGAFGVAHPEAALRLWDVATRVSGQQGEHEKKA